MKIKTTKQISYEDGIILSDSEYDAILEYANKQRQSGNAYNQIRAITIKFGELGASYTRESLEMKVTRSKGTR